MSKFFVDAIKKAIENSRIIKNPDENELNRLASGDAKITEFGNRSFVTKVRGRSTQVTEVIMKEPNSKQQRIIDEVTDYLKGKELLEINRDMCKENDKILHCRSYVSRKFARVGLIWGKMLFPSTNTGKTDIIVVDIPDYPENHVFIDAESNTTFILGTDYAGELKKAHLRHAMYIMKRRKNGLGLHAGSKLIRVRKENGKIIERGMLLFGLSATGKTTITCHHHWLDKSAGEGVVIKQDDVVLMDSKTHCAGTEDNFYIKTDGLEPESQPLLYAGVKSRNALLENVKVDRNGKIDFFDSTITSNGRAVVIRKELGYTEDSVDLPRADMFVFITRRNTIMPPIARLTPAQASAFFMLGESVWSSATVVGTPGKPKRVVGTNPFIMGPPEEEGNRFHDILFENPDIECYILNTGSVGATDEFKGEKITVRDSVTMLKEAARGAIEWKKDPDWGYEVPVKIPDIDMKRFDMKKYYNKKGYDKLTDELRMERVEWLAQFSGLYAGIRNAILK